LAMLNNEARELNDYRIEHFELGRYFDVFLSSCYLGLRKPDVKFFKLALDVLQRDPEEVAFIDDGYTTARRRRPSGFARSAIRMKRNARRHWSSWGSMPA
jgi:FMN phosphatase YigB (HAD superfamily)